LIVAVAKANPFNKSNPCELTQRGIDLLKNRVLRQFIREVKPEGDTGGQRDVICVHRD
jgi:hypothetical protein